MSQGFEPPYHREPPYPRHSNHGRRVHQRHPPPPPPPPMADRPPAPSNQKLAVARVPLANLPRSAPDSPGRQVSPRVGSGIPYPRLGQFTLPLNLGSDLNREVHSTSLLPHVLQLHVSTVRVVVQSVSKGCHSLGIMSHSLLPVRRHSTDSLAGYQPVTLKLRFHC